MANNQVSVNVSESGDTIIIPAIPGQTIQVYGVVLSLAAETTVSFKSGLGGSLLGGPMTLESLGLGKTPGDPWYITERGEPFVISLGAPVLCGGTVYFQPV